MIRVILSEHSIEDFGWIIIYNAGFFFVAWFKLKWAFILFPFNWDFCNIDIILSGFTEIALELKDSQWNFSLEGSTMSISEDHCGSIDVEYLIAVIFTVAFEVIEAMWILIPGWYFHSDTKIRVEILRLFRKLHKLLFHSHFKSIYYNVELGNI